MRKIWRTVNLSPVTLLFLGGRTGWQDRGGSWIGCRFQEGLATPEKGEKMVGYAQSYYWVITATKIVSISD
jgi:hypothetical protein